VVIVITVVVAGCSTMSYYGQAVMGQSTIIMQSRSVDKLLQDNDINADLRTKLELSQEIRQYAIERLALPDSGSYTKYAQLNRKHVVWNVFATLAHSVVPQTWCYPIVGCVAYKGFFSHARAIKFARKLELKGYDVHIAGVDAYSTLGYFDDPLLSTFIDYPSVDLAGLLFHEMAHQKLYIADDTVFNESFASTVAQAGVKQWLTSTGKDDEFAVYMKRQKLRNETIALMVDGREQLQKLFNENLSERNLDEMKKFIFSRLYTKYIIILSSFGLDSSHVGYRRSEFNNALVASFGIYNRYKPVFMDIILKSAGNFAVFYMEVMKLAQLPPEQREAYFEHRIQNRIFGAH
jgi:predicted aminopeptidase